MLPPILSDSSLYQNCWYICFSASGVVMATLMEILEKSEAFSAWIDALVDLSTCALWWHLMVVRVESLHAQIAAAQIPTHSAWQWNGFVHIGSWYSGEGQRVGYILVGGEAGNTHKHDFCRTKKCHFSSVVPSMLPAYLTPVQVCFLLWEWRGGMTETCIGQRGNLLPVYMYYYS